VPSASVKFLRDLAVGPHGGTSPVYTRIFLIACANARPSRILLTPLMSTRAFCPPFVQCRRLGSRVQSTDRIQREIHRLYVPAFCPRKGWRQSSGSNPVGERADRNVAIACRLRPAKQPGTNALRGLVWCVCHGQTHAGCCEATSDRNEWRPNALRRKSNSLVGSPFVMGFAIVGCLSLPVTNFFQVTANVTKA
jgi:hypothetical protein